MKISPEGADFIKRQESPDGKPVLEAYLCQAGIWTIGHGHTGDDVYEGLKITEDRAELLFDLDNDFAERAVLRECPNVTQKQFDALVSLCFNIGVGQKATSKRKKIPGFVTSSVARLHNQGEYAAAAQAFVMWNKVRNKQTGELEESRGLTARRMREGDMYLAEQVSAKGYLRASEAEGEQPLTASRTIRGGSIATAGTAATVGSQFLPAIESAPIDVPAAALPNPTTVLDSGATVINRVEETHSLIERGSMLLQQNWWVFAIVAAIGIGYACYARYNDRQRGRS